MLHPNRVPSVAPGLVERLIDGLRERGGVEFSVLSASHDRGAVEASLGEVRARALAHADATPHSSSFSVQEGCALLLQLETQMPGADVQFLSVFPRVAEVCFPPCAYISCQPGELQALSVPAQHSVTPVLRCSVIVPTESVPAESMPVDDIDADMQREAMRSQVIGFGPDVESNSRWMQVRRSMPVTPTMKAKEDTPPSAPEVTDPLRSSPEKSRKGSTFARAAPPGLRRMNLTNGNLKLSTYERHQMVAARMRELITSGDINKQFLADGIEQLLPAFESTTLVSVRCTLSSMYHMQPLQPACLSYPAPPAPLALLARPRCAISGAGGYYALQKSQMAGYLRGNNSRRSRLPNLKRCADGLATDYQSQSFLIPGQPDGIQIRTGRSFSGYAQRCGPLCRNATGMKGAHGGWFGTSCRCHSVGIHLGATRPTS